MKINKLILITGVAASGILTSGSFIPVYADDLNTGFTYLENFNNFGSQGQIDICNKVDPEGGGNCAADSAIDSFIFLEKQYPNIYSKGLKTLTPNYLSDNTDPTDTLNFAYDGWPQPNPTYKGYYARTGNGLVNYVNTAQDWIKYYASNTTTVESWFNNGFLAGLFTGVPTFNRTPTISDLEEPLKNNDAVQLAVYSEDGKDAHQINLTGISCDLESNCSIFFQDPNEPKNQQTSKITSGGANNALQVFVPSLNENLNILAETSFSPIIKSLKKIDLTFLIDTTGSTQPYISAIQDTTQSILNALDASGSSYRVAVADYKDFPQGPGEPGDYVYKADLPFSTDETDATSAIDNLANVVGGGGDTPEAAYSALMDTINAQGLEAWRNGASKDIVIISDAPPHDPEPYTGYIASDVITAAINADPISIYSIVPGINDNSYTASAYKYFSELSTQTGGQFFPAATSADIENDLLNITNQIITQASEPPSTSIPEPSSRVGILMLGLITFSCHQWQSKKSNKLMKNKKN